MSLALSGRMSGASNISCSCSMSLMMRSTSILFHHLVRRRSGSNGNCIVGINCERCAARPSRHAQTLDRGASRSSADVRYDDQFENGDIRELNAIFLDLTGGVVWAEIPLLTHDFPKRAPTIW